MAAVCSRGSPHFVARSKIDEEEVAGVLKSPLKAQPQWQNTSHKAPPVKGFTVLNRVIVCGALIQTIALYEKCLGSAH
jgi:hypothetical protein